MKGNSSRIQMLHGDFCSFYTRFLAALVLFLMCNGLSSLPEDAKSRKNVVLLYKPYTASHQRMSAAAELARSSSLYSRSFSGGMGLVAMAEDVPSDTMSTPSPSETAAVSESTPSSAETVEPATSTSGRIEHSDDVQPLSTTISEHESDGDVPAFQTATGTHVTEKEEDAPSSTNEASLSASPSQETATPSSSSTTADDSPSATEGTTGAPAETGVQATETPTVTQAPTNTLSAEDSQPTSWEHEPAQKPRPTVGDDDDEEEADQGLRELPKLSLKEYKAHLKQQQREAELSNLLDVNNVQGNPPEAPVNIVAEEEMVDSETSDSSKPDFASQAAGAVILAKNPEAKGAKNLLVDDKDAYCMSPCDKSKFVVVGLSEDILVDTVVLANYERYSSSIRDFLVLGSQRYPTNEWILLGNFTAEDVYGEQTFSVSSNPWTRYLKLVWLSHYGNEFYCTLTSLQVHGSTIMEDFRAEMQKSEEGDKISHVEEDRKRMNKEKSAEIPVPSATLYPASRKASEVVYESKHPKRNKVSSTSSLPTIHRASSGNAPEVPSEPGVTTGDKIELRRGSDIDESQREQAVKLPSNYVVFAALNLSDSSNDSEVLEDQAVMELPSHEQPVEYDAKEAVLDSSYAEDAVGVLNVTARPLETGWLHYMRGLNGLCFFTHDKRLVPEAEHRCVLNNIPPYNCIGKSRVVHSRRNSSTVLKEVKFNTSTSNFANTYQEAVNASCKKCPLPSHLSLVGYSWFRMIHGVCRISPTRYFEAPSKSLFCCPSPPASESSGTSAIRCCSESTRDWCCGLYSASPNNESTLGSAERTLLNGSISEFSGEDLMFYGENTSASQLENFSHPSLSGADSVLDSGTTFEGEPLADVLSGDNLQDSLKGKSSAALQMKATSGTSIFRMLTSRLKELAMEQQIMDEYLDNWQKQYEKIIQNYGARLDKHRLQLQSSKANYSSVKETVDLLEKNMQTLLQRMEEVERTEACGGFASSSLLDAQVGRFLAFAALLFSLLCAVICTYIIYLAKQYWDRQKRVMESYFREVQKLRQEMDGISSGYEKDSNRHVALTNGRSKNTTSRYTLEMGSHGKKMDEIAQSRENVTTTETNYGNRREGPPLGTSTTTGVSKTVAGNSNEQSKVPCKPIVNVNCVNGHQEREETSSTAYLNGSHKKQHTQNQ